MPRKISPATSLDHIRKEAKRWLHALRSGAEDARTRLERVSRAAGRMPSLRDVQHALAREYGFERWSALKTAIQKNASDRQRGALMTSDAYEQLANAYVVAFNERDAAALDRLNTAYRRTFSFEDLAAEIWRRNYAFRQRSSRVRENDLPLDEARLLVAQNAGFGSWDALMHAIATGASPAPAYAVDRTENQLSPQRFLSERDWDDAIAVIKAEGVQRVVSGGLVTDAVLAKLAELDQITGLDLSGSRQITDEGLLQLAGMPQLQHLNITDTALTDRALEVLQRLPNLRTFEMTWHRRVTDAGVANLRYCHGLERVDLMGSATGDGAVDALRDKPNLRVLKTGRFVTDKGLPLLHDMPRMSRLGSDRTGAELLIDGPFTTEGFARLAGLEGVVNLDVFWHAAAVTSDAFACLADLPNLVSVGADGVLSDNTAFRHFGALPGLQRLRAQEAVATDDGFEALAQSQTLEAFWGRECPNFASRGFLAFSRMPSLRSLGIACTNVADEALSSLPHFPSLTDLTPIGFTDDGFRHIGGCARLERLTCMYCRGTSDVATEHIAGLPLRYYYAGLTQITDRSLEILGRMRSLEQVELYECKGVTDAGLAFLAQLPTLREVSLSHLPRVTYAGIQAFPKHVRVQFFP
jgi:hypothetical protein